MTRLGQLSLLIKDYEEALEFYIHKLGFVKRHDKSYGKGMRWLTGSPHTQKDLSLILVKANSKDSLSLVGKQGGGFCLLVLETDDCYRDYRLFKARGVNFLSKPREVNWGIEVVFEDLYGNKLDLLQPKK